ncbi:hypothetical protein D3C73_1030380 [compost metagenome]
MFLLHYIRLSLPEYMYINVEEGGSTHDPKGRGGEHRRKTGKSSHCRTWPAAARKHSDSLAGTGALRNDLRHAVPDSLYDCRVIRYAVIQRRFMDQSADQHRPCIIGIFPWRGAGAAVWDAGWTVPQIGKAA